MTTLVKKKNRAPNKKIFRPYVNFAILRRMHGQFQQFHVGMTCKEFVSYNAYRLRAHTGDVYIQAKIPLNCKSSNKEVRDTYWKSLHKGWPNVKAPTNRIVPKPEVFRAKAIAFLSPLYEAFGIGDIARRIQVEIDRRTQRAYTNGYNTRMCMVDMADLVVTIRLPTWVVERRYLSHLFAGALRDLMSLYYGRHLNLALKTLTRKESWLERVEALREYRKNSTNIHDDPYSVFTDEDSDKLMEASNLLRDPATRPQEIAVNDPAEIRNWSENEEIY